MKIHIPAFPVDKYEHVVAGILIFMVFHIILGYMAIIPVVVIAVFKEWWDGRHEGHTRDEWDIVPTLIGGMLGMACYLPAVNW